MAKFLKILFLKHELKYHTAMVAQYRQEGISADAGVRLHTVAARHVNDELLELGVISHHAPTAQART